MKDPLPEKPRTPPVLVSVACGCFSVIVAVFDISLW